MYYILMADERSLGLFERRRIRYNFRAVQDKGTWRKRDNHELYKLFNGPDIAKYLKINKSKLEWTYYMYGK
jgi:hypothetical protein